MFSLTIMHLFPVCIIGLEYLTADIYAIEEELEQKIDIRFI